MRKWPIVVILALPVIIGTGMLVAGNSGGQKKFSPAPFKRIGLVQIRGAIMTSDDYVRQLRSLRQDNAIAGVLLQIDSPGGAVAPSQEIYSEVMKYRLEKKPIAVSMSSVAASGGYYIASPASRIFASAGTLTGSIGVIFTLPLYEELSKKVGIQFRVFKAGELKDVGSPYRSMTEKEQLFIRELLHDTHEQFIADVAKGRGMDPDSLLPFADGRVLTGRQALALHLIDTLGGYEAAHGWLCDRTGISSNAKVVERKAATNRLREWIEEESTTLFPALQQLIRPAGLYFMMSLK
jgi:protease-4